MMKRGRENEESFESIDMTKCLMSMSQDLETKPKQEYYSSASSEDVFECKTCHRKFPSFQALGGHRASHKKPRLMMGDRISTKASDSKFKCPEINYTVRPKMHECGICGKKFAMGQALGGHMRKHRPSIYGSFNPFPILPIPISIAMPVLSRSNSKRILCLDLNLTPLENDLIANVWGNHASQSC